MPRVVGLEICSDRVRAVEVQGTPRSLSVTQFVEEPIQPPPPPVEGQTAPPADPIALAIESLFARHGLPRGATVAGLDAGQMMFRHVQVPFTSDHHIRETLPSEIEHHVFNVSMENSVVEYYKVRQADNASLLFVGTASKEFVGKNLKAMAACGIDPIALDVDLMALFNCLARCGVFADKPNAIVLSLDVLVSRLLIVEGGRLHSARTFRVAAPISTSTTGDKAGAAPTMLGRPAEGAEQKLQFHLDAAHASSLTASLHAPSNWAEYAARIQQEVSRALLAFPLEESPTTAILTGALPGLADRAAGLGEALHLPVEVFEPSRHFEGPCFANGTAAAAAGTLSVPLGLALKGLEYDVGGMDFRKDEFRYEKRFDAIKRAILACAALVLMLFALVAFYFYLRRRVLEGTMRQAADFQIQCLQNAYPEAPIPEGADLLKHMQDLAAQEHALYGRTDTPLVLSSIDVWKMMFEEIMKFNMDVKKISVDQSRGQMRALVDGTGDSRQTIEQVLNRLKAKPDFSNAQIQGSIVITTDGRYTYQYLIPLPERQANAQ